VTPPTRGERIMRTSAIDYLVSFVYVCTGDEALWVRNPEALEGTKEGKTW
jgi:hypothetical protein